MHDHDCHFFQSIWEPSPVARHHANSHARWQALAYVDCTIETKHMAAEYGFRTNDIVMEEYDVQAALSTVEVGSGSISAFLIEEAM